MEKIITIVKVIDDDIVLKESLDEILDSNIYKKNKLQLLLIDLINTNKTKKYIKENNLEENLLKLDNVDTVSKAFQESKKYVEAKYINFSTTSSFIERSTLDLVVDELSTNHCVILNPIHYATDNLKYVEKYFRLPKELYDYKNYFSIKDNINFFNPLLDSYFFEYSKVKNIDFIDDTFTYSLKYIMDIMLEFNHYLFIQKDCYYTKVLENDFANNYDQYSVSWYIDFVRDFALTYLKENNNKWCQYAILYLVAIRYSSNMNARNKNVLDNKLFEEFEGYVKKILEYIDYDILKEFNSVYVSKIVIQIFISMKSEDNLKLAIENGNVILKHDDNVVLESERMNLDIKVLEYEDDKLFIDAEILGSIFIKDSSQIKAYVNDKEVKYKETNVYTYTKFFNKIRHKKFSFRLEIPLELLNSKKNNIYFEYIYKKSSTRLNVTFNCPLSKLNLRWYNTYFKFDKKILTYNIDDKEIIIKRKNFFKILKKEFCLIFEYLFRSRKNKILGIKSVGLRMLYWITKPFYKKRIWISFDKLFKGGDNGEYFYHYVSDNKKDVKMCYVINKNSDDYNRLSKQKCKNILPFRSIKHYLNVLNCEFMFATHANPFDYNGYTSGVEKYFRDLLTFKTFCIQHGLSVNQIAKFQNRVYASTKLYFCASKYEIKNLNLPEYDYDGYDALRLTGVPRYDGLKNNEKKIILITPTWRQSSSSKLVHLNMARQYNKEFKDSMYYKVYNNLINDPKLVECAKKNGYKIIYLLHPAVSSQAKDFKGNEYVDIIAATSDMSYEKILTESSLMVTDYSGVQFDFAYMRKPILYYHPTTLPPHYEESCFIYESMGFGPIIENQDELVSNLCEYMNSGCKMKEKYIDRANDFFEYSDYNNCKRIVEEVDKYVENKK